MKTRYLSHHNRVHTCWDKEGWYQFLYFERTQSWHIQYLMHESSRPWYVWARTPLAGAAPNPGAPPRALRAG